MTKFVADFLALISNENGGGPKVVFGATLFAVTNHWASASNIFDVRGKKPFDLKIVRRSPISQAWCKDADRRPQVEQLFRRKLFNGAHEIGELAEVT